MTTTTRTNQHGGQIALMSDSADTAAPVATTSNPKPKRGRKPRKVESVLDAVATAPTPAPAPAPVIELVKPASPPATPVEDETSYNPVIKVIGVGGGGGNAVAHMIKSGLGGVEFIVANTDMQAIRNTGAARQLQIGRHVTRCLGAGLVPETGRQAALEDKELIKDALQGTDMVFIAAGMGGGTGTGAAPVIAQLARELDILTVAVVTKPFTFEGKKKMQIAQAGIDELAQHCDTLMVIPNDKVLGIPGRKVAFLEAFRIADDVLLEAVRGIYDLIVRPGLMNLDFADVRTVMGETSLAMMGTGRASGDDRAQAALEAAIQNPLLDDIHISGATGILVNVVAGPDFGMDEYGEIGQRVAQIASEDAFIKPGFVLDPQMKDEVQVTIIATGLQRAARPQPQPQPPPQSSPYRVQADDSVLRVRPKIELVRSSGKRDGTTGMWVDEPGLETGGVGIASLLRGNHARGEPAAQPKTALSQDAYLETDIDIPAFLRRQAD